MRKLSLYLFFVQPWVQRFCRGICLCQLSACWAWQWQQEIKPKDELSQHKPQTGEGQTMEGVWMREREKGIGKNHVHMWGKIIQQGNHPAREHTFRDINDTRQNHPVWGKNPRWQTCIRENHPAKASSRKTQTGRRMKCRLHRAAKSSDQGCPRNLAQPSSSSRPKHEPNYTSIDPK